MFKFDRTELWMVGIAGVGAILAMGLTMLTMALGAPLPVRFGALAVFFAFIALGLAALARYTIRTLRAGNVGAVLALLLWIFIAIALARGLARLLVR